MVMVDTSIDLKDHLSIFSKNKKQFHKKTILVIFTLSIKCHKIQSCDKMQRLNILVVCIKIFIFIESK